MNFLRGALNAPGKARGEQEFSTRAREDTGCLPGGGAQAINFVRMIGTPAEKGRSFRLK